MAKSRSRRGSRARRIKRTKRTKRLRCCGKTGGKGHYHKSTGKIGFSKKNHQYDFPFLGPKSKCWFGGKAPKVKVHKSPFLTKANTLCNTTTAYLNGVENPCFTTYINGNQQLMNFKRYQNSPPAFANTMFLQPTCGMNWGNCNKKK